MNSEQALKQIQEILQTIQSVPVEKPRRKTKATKKREWIDRIKASYFTPTNK